MNILIKMQTPLFLSNFKAVQRARVLHKFLVRRKKTFMKYLVMVFS